MTSSDESAIKKTSINEILNIIKYKTKSKKSPGYDGINGKLLKELPLKAIIYLRNLFNAIMQTKHFPATWKVAEIIAIAKPNKDASQATSYRPISLLPVLSKIFEHIISERLEKYLEKAKTIPMHQFGFRRKHSTIQQIHRVVDKIMTDIDNKRYCVAIYLDVAKAFDSVWHKGLLHKLEKLVPKDLYLLLKSYTAPEIQLKTPA